MPPVSPSASDRSAAARPDATLSVNETIRRWPAAIAVLNAIGVDTCCGGAASLDAAAAEAGVSTSDLLDALAHAIAMAELRG